MNRRILSGQYCGPDESLRGERAILMNEESHRLLEDDRGQVLAQFNNVELEGGPDLGWAHGWHSMPRTYFGYFNFLELGDL